MPQTPISDEVQSVPQIRARLKEVVAVLNTWIRAEGKAGIKITQSDTNVIISAEDIEQDGGGIPEGFEEKEVLLVEDDNNVAEGFILFKPKP
jgi:hypothetical protein